MTGSDPTSRQPRCRFCDHRFSMHGALGCEHATPIRVAYGAHKGRIAATRGCPCDLTRIELRDGVDAQALTEITRESRS